MMVIITFVIITFVIITFVHDGHYHICRMTLWRVLEMRIGDNKILKILKKLYENTTAKISGCDTIIDVMIGLRQGGPESCVLFNY